MATHITFIVFMHFSVNGKTANNPVVFPACMLSSVLQKVSETCFSFKVRFSLKISWLTLWQNKKGRSDAFLSKSQSLNIHCVSSHIIRAGSRHSSPVHRKDLSKYILHMPKCVTSCAKSRGLAVNHWTDIQSISAAHTVTLNLPVSSFLLLPTHGHIRQGGWSEHVDAITCQHKLSVHSWLKI